MIKHHQSKDVVWHMYISYVVVNHDHPKFLNETDCVSPFKTLLVVRKMDCLFSILFMLGITSTYKPININQLI